jgi:hypothetical protein
MYKTQAESSFTTRTLPTNFRFTLQGLSVYTVYEAYLVVQNVAGSTSSSPVTVQTLADAPTGIKTPTISQVMGSVTLEWAPVERINGPTVVYSLRWRTAGTTPGSVVTVCSGLLFMCTVSPVLYDTDYEFQLLVSNTVASNSTAWVLVHSFSGIPAQAQRPIVQEIDVTWATVQLRTVRCLFVLSVLFSLKCAV